MPGAKILIGCAVIVVAIAQLVATSLNSGTAYYLTVSELQAQRTPAGRIVRVSGGGTEAFLTTVFGGPARPAPTVTIDAPDGEFVDGRAVRVVVAGFVPGEHVQAMLCAAPASYAASGGRTSHATCSRH